MPPTLGVSRIENESQNLPKVKKSSRFNLQIKKNILEFSFHGWLYFC